MLETRRDNVQAPEEAVTIGGGVVLREGPPCVRE